MYPWLTPLAVGLLAGPAAADPVDYTRDVKPLLQERCYACHGVLKQKGKLRLDTVAFLVTGGRSGAAVKPGDPAASLLLERVGDTDDARRMPPEGKPLTAGEVARLRAWVEQGAKGPADEKPEADPKDHGRSARRSARRPRPRWTRRGDATRSTGSSRRGTPSGA